METKTKWLLAIGGAVATVLVAVGIYEEKKSASSGSKTTGSKAPPSGGCPAGTYWNGNACIHQVVFQAPYIPPAQGPQSIQQITLDAGNLNPAPIKTFNGIFTVYSPPVQGNTGGGWINSASSNPASLIPLAALINRNSSVQVALSDATGTASFNWYDADSGQTLTTNLTFVA